MSNAKFKSQIKQQSRGRLILIALAVVVMIVAVVYATTWSWSEIKQTDFFAVTNVVVQDDSPIVSSSQIKTLVQENLSGGFFSLKLMPVKQLILKNPWVDQVAFNRVWPNTLIVLLREKQPLARWNDGGVLTASGDVFYPPAKTISKELPQFIAQADQAQQMLAQYQAFSVQLKPLSLAIRQICLSPEGNWSVTLSNHIKIILGNKAVMARFERLMHVYRKLEVVRRESIAMIDLRYPTGFSVSYAKT